MAAAGTNVEDVDDEVAAKLRARLRELDPDGLAPRAALDLVYELTRLARG
jgi:hypothetical protein